ncbi:1-acylglycerol-3-phosphate O-acyltransferase [Scenedesmus sp. PABB004]|nr:1-acylglycerol-3-phosphate O-acyltransferase [Scenedesmus sp. PABB004]
MSPASREQEEGGALGRAVTSAEAEALTSLEAPSLPWWLRASRWRQTSKAEAVAAERGLLGLLRGRWRVEDVPVAASPEHYVHATTGGEPGAPALVLMPGYGAGTGFFFRNLDGLAKAFQVFAVDWLGTGLSGRPDFTPADRAGTEAFFLDSLNAWRAKAGLSKFILPPKPEGWERRFMSDAWSVRSALFRLAGKAWASGVTPGSVIRALGPWGPGLVERYVSGRFSMHGLPLSEREREALTPYFYGITAQRGSGEYALRHILAPGAWAYAPLAERLLQLEVPVSFIYGEHDWMNPAAGQAVADALDAARRRTVPSDHRVDVLPDSGHFVFLEQPHLFNAALLRALAPHLPAGRGDALAAEEEAAHADALRRAAAERSLRDWQAQVGGGAPPTGAPQQPPPGGQPPGA